MRETKEITNKPREITQKEIDAVKVILDFIGEDSSREGLQDTPRRFLKAWREYWGSGYGKNAKDLMKVFEDGGENYDEMVIESGIKVFSHCEHHIAPIIGYATVAYIPNGKIIGLSKMNRLVDMFARRLQVQERLTAQIAQALWEELQPQGVAVSITADHFCVKTRGIQDVNSTTTTNKLLGCFKDDKSCRDEFLNFVNRGVK